MCELYKHARKFRSTAYELIIILNFEYLVTNYQHIIFMWHFIGLMHMKLFYFYNSVKKVLLSSFHRYLNQLISLGLRVNK